ncbi:MAG: M20/M25/M40 family metallo-hydrolase, partial [Clostridia bacterium]|nr:M20/M25/M40 family metallo-hydrolase [Clostridia bacterium]
MIVTLSVLGVLVLFLAFLVIRALAFKPSADDLTADTSVEEFDRDGAVTCLQALLRCKTVSRVNHEEEDEAEFRKLIDLLPTLYPHVFETATLTRMDDRALLFRWKGKTAGDPAVLMAHYDVVPVDVPEAWEKPAFDGVIENGVLWGRGALDTKVTFNSVLYGAEQLIKSGFTPEHDVYFAFSGGEEVNGKGAVHIRDYFKEQGIHPALVVDEGGAVVEGIFPGVKGECALIGIAEKGMINVKYEVNSNGGHASAPKPHTPVGILSEACANIENHPFRSHLTKPVAEMFDTLGRRSTFVYRLIFANYWLFGGLLDGICKKSGGELNAMMRTTVAFTQMKGSDAANVIPQKATMISNIAAGNIAIHNNCKGPCIDVVTACATSTNCIGEAFRAIRHGYADAIVTGGCEHAVIPLGVAGFANAKALSKSEDPKYASLPF